MAIRRGNSIITNGLVYYSDISNSESYVSGSTQLYDLTKINDSATLSGGTSFDSKYGGGIIIDGIDGLITSPAVVLPNEFTITQILKCTFGNSIEAGFMPIGGGDRLDGADYRGYVWFRPNNNQIRVRINGEVGPTFSNINASLFNNKLISYTTTRNGNTSRFYINGVLLSSTLDVANDNFDIRTIGSSYNYGAYTCSGSIYSTKLYDRPLTSEEILTNFNAQREKFGL